METKVVSLSSAGLKNIISNKNDFHFIFGDRDIPMSNVFAEFISPNVSHLHQVDPTIDSICIDKHSFSVFGPFKEILSQDIIKLFYEISSGSSISINEEQNLKMIVISLAIGNNELLEEITKQFPFNENETISNYFIQILQNISNSSGNNDFILHNSAGFNVIARNFISFDKNKLLSLPKQILYSIISNENLKIENEDSLLDFIVNIFEKDHDTNSKSPDDISFLEQIRIQNLSKDKFNEFLQLVDPNKISYTLWRNLCQRFTESEENDTTINKERYDKLVKFNQRGKKSQDIFNGIICRLNDQCGGNSAESDLISITASSCFGPSYRSSNVADLDSTETIFSSIDTVNSYLMYDFKLKKVRLTAYSIRSAPYVKDRYHLKSWNIEGSNTARANDWTVLDSRNNDASLNGKSASCKFNIQNSTNYYRYIRIKQTGSNFSGDDFLVLSALEFFGSII